MNSCNFIPRHFKILSIFCLILSLASCNDSTKNSEPSSETKTESTSKTPVEEEKQSVPELDAETSKSIAQGESVYTQNCAVCHQKNGGGVPNLNPPLKGADYTVGDKTPLITLLLQGSSDEQIEVNGKTYSNVMPPFNTLEDDEIANVLTYIRNSFGNRASAVTAEEVEGIRSSLE